MTRVAAIQMTSGPDVDANLRAAEQLLAEAAADGVRLAVLPENFAFMGMREADKLEIAETADDGPIQSFLSARARTHDMWLVGGTVPMRVEGDERVAAACLVYDERGRVVGRYDKIHMFDVQIPGRDECYRESASTTPGDHTLVIDSPAGRLGLTVCYDLRFPDLFRELSEQGMEIVALPAAFTAATGRAHWEVLVRARAIENQCFVIAAAQGGSHPNGRETHGDSMIADPWGTVLDRLPHGDGWVAADIDRDAQKSTRRSFPVLTHRRPTA